MVRHPEETKDYIAEAQKLVEAGKYRQAHELYESKIIMSSAPPVGSYQTMGDLWIEFTGGLKPKQEGYIRKLDPATGLITIKRLMTDGSVITEEILSSAVDDCIAVRISTSADDGLDFDVSITRPFKKRVTAVVKDDDKLVLEGQARYERKGDEQRGTKFYTILKALPEGGSVKGGNGELEIRGAKAVTLLLTCSTDFNRMDPRSPLRDGWADKAVLALEKGQTRSWDDIKKDSMRDVFSFMDRCDVELGDSGEKLNKMPTDDRLEAFKSSKFDPDLLELYFQFGRYLAVCSSRPGTLPTNLQGMWADGLRNMWNCDYHLNINIQLHYLSVEPTNLSELHEPFFRHLNNLRAEGRKMAAAYGAKGFCSGHETNPWGRTINRARRARWSGSVITGAWCAFNVMEHYRYTQDADWLERVGWPILNESCEFVESWVIRDKDTGKWVPKAGCSHEIGFYYIDGNGKKQMSEIGPVTAYDQSVIWQVMGDYLEAAAVLGVEDSFTETVKAKLAELERPRIGKDGYILEWGIEDVEEVDVHHRHQSHIVGLHPGNVITKKKTPELFEAAGKSLERRGNKTMGWSQSWKISLYARLYDGEAALGQFKKLLCEQTQPNMLNLAGRFFNLDGNYGTPAGVVEMLMQSHEGVVHLLPALPDEWKDGSVKGIVARGGFVVDIGWKDGKLFKAEILSRYGGELKVRYGDVVKSFDTRKGQRVEF